MRAILLGPIAGSYRHPKKLLSSLRVESKDLLIGVDGGTQTWLNWGYRPHCAIGDWDSLKSRKKILSQIPHLSLSKDKDRSDLFFAVRAAIELGAQELVCLGVTGGKRLDHHLATLFDLSVFSTGKYGKLKSVQAAGVDGEYHFLSESISRWVHFSNRRRLVSIFAIGGEVAGVTLSGFQYGLKNVTLKLSSLGLSNWTEERKCEVRLRKGQLLVIIPRHGLI
jgi:thiamine pyrophosphokinase